MSAVETEIINKSKIKPLEWKRYIDDVFSLWDTRGGTQPERKLPSSS